MYAHDAEAATSMAQRAFGFRQLGGDLRLASVAEGLFCDLTPAAIESRLANVTRPGVWFDLRGP
jgi:hypothetical protein